MALFMSRCFVGALSILLVACGGPNSQEQKLPPGAQLRVDTTSQLVTLDIKNVPFRAVLSELGRQTQITVSVPDNLQFDNLSLSFENVPLEDALKRVLAGQSYSFVYKQDRGRNAITGVRLLAKQDPVPPAELRTAMTQMLAVLPGHAGVQVSAPLDQPIPATTRTPATGVPMDDVALDDLKRSFSESQNPALKSEILEAIAGSGTEEAQPVVPILAAALSDHDEEVRATALNLLKSSSDPVPLGPLAMMTATDKNPDLRMDAMTLMADQLLVDGRTKEEWMTAKASLAKGLSDPNPEIREQAALTLDELSQIGQPSGTKKRF